MSGFNVRDVVIGQTDFTGSPVLEIYGKVSTRYAVYRNTRQVMIQFSDDDAEGVNQRSSMTPLLPMRSAIGVAIAKLQAEESAYQKAKAEEYASRLGAALVVALQGNVALSAADLQVIARDLHEDRASDTRTRHIIWAALAALVTILFASVCASSWFMNAFSGMDAAEWPGYWYAASIGAVGALFSIALQLRSRQVRVDTQPWDNISDAVLRILVGATSAVLLTALFKGRIIDLRIGGQPIADTPAGMLVLAFAGGFTERLVAEFLSTIGLAAREQPTRVLPTVAKVQDEEALAAGAAMPVRQRPAPPEPSSGNRLWAAAPAPILEPEEIPREEAELAPDEDEEEFRGTDPGLDRPLQPLPVG